MRIILLCLLLSGCAALDATGPSWSYVVGQPCTLHVDLVLRDGSHGDMARHYIACPDTTGMGSQGQHYRITR